MQRPSRRDEPSFGLGTIHGRRSILTGLTASVSLSLIAGCAGGALDADSGSDSKRTPLPGRAGLLAPLSGSSSGLGQIMRNAASLGGNVLSDTGEIGLYDTGDTPEKAVAAARLAVGAGARMLVGPLFGAQAEAVGRAVGSSVPVVTLSNDTSIASRNVFVMGLTPEQSARSVLGFAARRGLASVGVVVPPGEFGQRAAAAAVAAGRSLGMQIINPITTNDPGTARAALLQAAGGNLPAAVYLPSAGPELDVLAAAFNGSTQILGSSQWSARDPSRTTALRDAWFAAPDPVAFEPFALAYQDAHGEAAGILGGIAFDAIESARLLGRIRQQDREGLLRENGFNGVIGPYRFESDGTCTRGLAVLKVGAGAITLIGSTSV
jgi:ABC-type branched-subunit amino acid transport system substrate-binding protein